MQRHLAVLCRAVVSAALFVGCATTGGSAGDVPAAGQPLPDLTLRSLNGGPPTRLSDLRGKIVVLDIWASWCAPCKEELPQLDDLATRLGPKGVVVLAVSVDEEPEAAREFLRTKKTWALTVAHDPTGSVPNALNPTKMPTSYIVDATGVIRHINAGFEPGDAARIETKVRDLLAKQ